MNRTYFSAASAVLILWSLPPAHGSSKPRDEAPTTEAKNMLEEIDAWSAGIADTAFHLNEMAKSQRDPQAHLDGLAALREDVNRIGRYLQTLEAERDSLAAWEAKALDRAFPLMHEIADNAEKAILTYQSDRQRLWATPYVEETEKSSEEANQVAAILHDYLKLAKTRDKESRLEHSVSGSPGF